MMNTARNRPPFTASQWQELEQQALVFKYMVSGTPIPPDLIYSIKRSLDSSISSRLFTHHPGVGWGCFEMGFGRKIDPEPGRCRRTDGKKWRCSKEAYPDSKYCEKHMHRGRNRSRKPVEVPSSTSSITTNTSQAISSYSLNRGLSMMSNNPNNNTPSISSSFPFSESSSQYPYQNSSLNPFFYTNSTSTRPPDSDFSSHSNTTHQLFLDSGSYSQDEKDYRNIHVDERAFFPEASGSARGFPDSYHQLSMGSYNKSYSNSHQFQSLNDNDSNPRQQEEEQHCFILGTDFKSPRPGKSEKDTGTETTQRPLHHFFGDQWTQKNTDSWLDLASNSRIPTDE
ncbi:growth-regulating factor 5-like [Neltuma alba]|uniref:growth-regulating factor 5-like n=1 Tax=Neltuma alba TaxID=207710 RepID=UPI0010A540EB|nr:growth-regulating factor 5-like [Prosopis alba]